MTSSCIQLCQRCTSLLRSKTVSVTLQYSPQVQLCTAAVFRAGSLFMSGNHTTAHTRPRWNQQIRFYSDYNAKRVTAEAKVDTDVAEELSGLDAVPVTDSQITLDLDAVANRSALEEISDEEAVSLSVPSDLPPASTSLRAYVDKSETLSKLVQLGVNLWKLEQRPNVGSMLLRLDFQADVAPRLLFLKQIGVEDSRLGYIISYNPFILTESLDNLQARVKYLLSMKFSSESVASMVSKAPYLLNFSVKRLDNRLSFYQKELGLSAPKTRDVVARLPRLLCGSLEPVKETLKVCKMELGFKENEIQHIVTSVPKVLTIQKKKLIQIFDYLHNTMKVPHHLMVKFPQVFNSNFLRIRERHLFLEYLGKAQFDPSQPSYIPLDRLVSLPDDVFCTEVASATFDDFNLFQKTM